MAHSGPHDAVLLREAVAAVIQDPDGVYIDGTFGRGGHSAAMLERLGPQGRLIAFDKDPEAVAVARSRFARDPRFEIVQASFAQLATVLADLGVKAGINGVLVDLGVSSPQLDQAERGFSFLRDGPLDMRMNPDEGQSAAQWLARVEESELARVLKEYGEEKFALRIARAVCRARESQPITRTVQLAGIVAEAHPAWEKGRHPATKTFQAIRIFINNELGDLEQLLKQALDVLAVGGRLVVISFHSLEDRIVKRFIKKNVQGDDVPAHIPLTKDQLKQRLRHVGKAVKAGPAEVDANIRARSAIMRVAEKIA